MTPNLLNRLSLALVAALLCASLILLGTAVLHPLPGAGFALGEEAGPTTTEVNTPKRERYVMSRLENAFLPNANPARAQGKSKDKKLPASGLKAKLVGTVTSDDPQEAYAVIEYQNNQDLYRVGEHLENSEVVEIGRGSVVLRQDGKDTQIVIPEQ